MSANSGDTAIKYTLESFTPSPGFVLLETIEDQSNFKPTKQVDDTTNRLGRILSIGEPFLNEHGNTVILPEGYEVGSEVLYRWFHGNDVLELDYKEYPLVQYNQIRGKLR